MVSDDLHNSTVLLEVRLTDVNDRNPAFNSSIQYSANVPEVCCPTKKKYNDICMCKELTAEFPY